MDRVLKKPIVFFIVALVVLLVFSFIDFGLFHFLVDFFTIFIGLMIFIIAINSRVYTEKMIYLVLAVSYLYISSLDLLHLITLFDITSIGASLNQSYQYFASARIFEAFVLILIFGFITSPGRVNYKVTHIIGAVVLVTIVVIIQFDIVGTYYVNGVGQSNAKLFVSYITGAMFILSAYFANKSNLSSRQKSVLVIVLLLKSFAQIIHANFVLIGDGYQTVAMILRFLSYVGLYLIFVQEIITSSYENVYSLFETKQKELLTLSERDSLTGMFNHSLTFKNIEKLINVIGTKYQSLCVILFDIDNFKQINDSFGHIKGDEVLKLFTNSLYELKYKDQMVGRYGGDEFVLAIPDCKEPKIGSLFVKLNEELKDIAKLNGVQITFSAGVVLWRMGDNATDLIRKADIKMYEAKEKGKNQYIIWQHEVTK